MTHNNNNNNNNIIINNNSSSSSIIPIISTPNPTLTLALTALHQSTTKTAELLNLVAQGDLPQSKSLAMNVILPLHSQALQAIKSLDDPSPFPSPTLSTISPAADPSSSSSSSSSLSSSSSSSSSISDSTTPSIQTVDFECQLLAQQLTAMHRQVAALRAMLTPDDDHSNDHHEDDEDEDDEDNDNDDDHDYYYYYPPPQPQQNLHLHHFHSSDNIDLRSNTRHQLDSPSSSSLTSKSKSDRHHTDNHTSTVNTPSPHRSQLPSISTTTNTNDDHNYRTRTVVSDWNFRSSKRPRHSSPAQSTPPSPTSSQLLIPRLETPSDLVTALNGSAPRYKNGTVVLAPPIRGHVLVHIPLTPRSLPNNISQRYLNSIVNSFKTKGTSKTILEAIVNRGPLNPTGTKSLVTQLQLTAQWNVLNAVLRWWARPLVVVEFLDRQLYPQVWDTLITAVGGINNVPTNTQLAVLVGITCVGFELGVFNNSRLPPRDTMTFRITEYHALIVNDRDRDRDRHGLS